MATLEEIKQNREDLQKQLDAIDKAIQEVSKPTLPDTLHELMLVAIDDLERAEETNGYKVSMGCWHEPLNGSCHVCFAGSVIAFSLSTGRNEDKAPCDFDCGIEHKLEALDYVRSGLVKDAAEGMGTATTLLSTLPESLEVVDYHQDPVKFKTQMRLIASWLGALGV